MKTLTVLPGKEKSSRAVASFLTDRVMSERI